MEETLDTPQRLFFALWPSDEARAALAGWRDALPRPGGRPTAARNLHLTLAFAGDVDAETRTCLEQAAARVRGEPFSLPLDRLGVFKRGCSGPAPRTARRRSRPWPAIWPGSCGTAAFAPTRVPFMPTSP